LITDPDERRRLEERASEAAKGPYSWDRIAEQTTAVYERVLA
jgi:glycosyltransferase involved in cell wall biosynthesis